GPSGTATGPGTTVQIGSRADSGTDPGWPEYRHDLANTGFANDTRITAGNVAKLGKVWATSGVTGVSGTPAVVDGVVYYGDWTGKMNAVKADTGDNIWSTPMEGGWVIGGPAVHDDGVYIGVGKTLFRLDRTTGA